MLSDFVDMLFPRSCLTCSSLLEKNEEIICVQCRYALPKTNFHLEEDNELARKFWGRIPLKHAFAYLRFVKTGKVQVLLHHLKYYGKQEIGEMLGRWYGNDLKKSQLATQFDLILPVPLHPSKLEKRGYNQCDSIARGMAEGLSVAWDSGILVRQKANVSQTRKDRVERWENVANIFYITKPEKVKGKNILLIDDVITTGATLEACGLPLQNAGCQSLSIAGLAVAW
ncbi:MAG: ComF family protein [Cytophagales bacterium]|nr:MAG: ComF family protein [Cytophagales bacterium]